MAYVDAYRKCDICGQKLNKKVEEFNYRIEPRGYLRMRIFPYIFGDPYDSFWSGGIDMCSSCWEEMKKWINMKKNERIEI